MRILFDITHPAHVHLFRNAIDALKKKGHELKVTSREKEITTELLDTYDIAHTCLSKSNGRISLAKEWILREIRLLSAARSFRPDIIVSRFNPAVAHISTVLGCPYIMFEDTEKESNIITKVTYPLADLICTPDSFAYDLGEKHIRYDGLHELAYLHPNWFNPDKELLESYGVSPNEPFSILRFVSWDAHHDANETGLSANIKRELVSRLSKYGTVYITSEDDLPDDLAEYQLPIPPKHVHHLLYYADLFVGDSQTMTCEAGVLGTPAIRSNSLASPDKDHASYLQELEEKYNIVFSITDQHRATELAESIMANIEQQDWQKKRLALIEEKIDVTDFMVSAILQNNEDDSQTHGRLLKSFRTEW